MSSLHHQRICTSASAEKEIIRGLTLEVPKGEVHAVMGPNGSGKSTLSKVIGGHPDYAVTSGEVLLDGENILELGPDERARAGLFLAFQYPMEIPGVLECELPPRRAAGAPARRRGDSRRPTFTRSSTRRWTCWRCARTFTARSVNEGFSGGEKKRNEILQMAMLKPKYAILDETDSGLDIDALKIVAAGVNALRGPEPRHPRHHALPAPARLHRARCRARDGRWPHRPQRRQGARARTRRKGLRLAEGRSSPSPQPP